MPQLLQPRGRAELQNFLSVALPQFVSGPKRH